MSTLALLILAGCSDTKLSTFNDAPEAVIISPEDGAAEQEGVSFQLLGRVSDTDHDALTLEVSWLVDEEERCGPLTPDEAGTVSCELALEAGEYAVTLVVSDPQGASGSDQITLVVEATGTPVVNIEAPTEGASFYADEAVALEATVTDAEDLTTALAIAWESDLSGPLDVELSYGSGGAVSSEVYLVEGEHTLTLTATDSHGKVGEDHVSVSVGPANSAPTCAITAPEEGASGSEGEAVDFEGVVGDADQAAPELAVAWRSDLDGALGGEAAGSDGVVRLSTSALRTGTHEITLSATDERGAACEASVLYTVGTPPSIALESPVDGARYTLGEPVSFSAEVSDGEDAARDLQLSWESDLDGVFSTEGADSGGVAAFTEDGLSAGTHSLTVTVTDSDGFYARATGSFVINTPPEAPTVSISPAAPTTDDDLAVVIEIGAADPDGDSVSYSYAWYRDGVSTGYTADTLPASATSRDQEWSVVVTPYDADGAGEAGEAAVTVLNTAPTMPAVSISPSDPEPGEELLCSIDAESADADGDAVSYAITWTVDGATYSGAATTDRPGDTIRGTATEAEQVWECAVTPGDGTDEGPADTATVTISCEYFTFYEDADEDGYGDDATAAVDCEAPDEGMVEVGGDCDDADDEIHPGASEWCDGIDNDCEEEIDEPQSADALPWYLDDDEDGYGDPGESTPGCEQPAGYVADSTDCDDSDAGVYPWAGDAYGDGVDQDCDGLDCEAADDGAVYFAVCPAAVGWHDGRADCQDAGYTDLASVQDADEQAYLEGLLADAGLSDSVAPWIAYADEIVEGYWGWSDGASTTYTHWGSGEPNGGTDEDCAQMNWPLGSGSWNDADCYGTEDHQGYACALR